MVSLRRLWPALALSLFAFHTWRYHEALLDDAFISLRYARNWVEGHGLVFNPGERVEGYTNFLWTAFGALFLRLGLDAVVGWKAVSFAAALTTVALLRRAEREHAFSALPAAAWLLAAEAFGYTATTTLETMLFAALITAGTLLSLDDAARGSWRAPPLFVAAALTRPEGVLAFALAEGAVALGLRRSLGVWPIRRTLLRGAAFALPYGVFVAWRLAYYGALLPNTFYAKVTGGIEQWLGGLLGLKAWALAYPCFALAPFATLLRRDACAAARTRAGVVLGFMGYAVAVGGDFMPFHRFFLPVMPLAALVLAGELRARPLLARAAPALLLLQIGAGLFSEQPQRAFVADRTTRAGFETGRFLARTLPPGSLVALNAIGGLSWESRLPVLDMLGLTEPAVARSPVYVTSPRWVAHRRGSGEHVLSRRPQAILFYNAAGLAEPHYLSDRQLADSPVFRFFYQLKTASLPPDPEQPLSRFLGDPFGVAGRGGMPELGIALELRPGWPRLTVARSRPLELVYFELRRDRLELWDDPGAGADALVEAAVARWSATPRPAPDLAVRAVVEELCERALQQIQAGDRAAARPILSEAVARNATALSPRPYQYVANLAALDGQLFLAVQAQSEALRLDPGNALFRHNLGHLLRVPYAAFRTQKPSTSR